jgi:hypothetical protein
MRLLVGDGQEHIGVAGTVERAVAGKVAPTQLSSCVLNRDLQSTGEQIITITTDRLFPTELQRVRIAPLGGPGHDDDALGKLRSSTT